MASVVTAVAAILETPRPERLYAGLSVLVSAATDGRPARGLVSHGALGLLATGELDRDLRELLDAAAELPDCRLWACAAAAERLGLDRAALPAPLAGVMSTPRFLREAGADARLLFV